MNFLQAAREEQEVEEEEEVVEERVQAGRKRKAKVSAYEFFQEMRAVSERPLEGEAA